MLTILPVTAFARDSESPISRTDLATTYSDGLKGPVQSVASYLKLPNRPPRKTAYYEYNRNGILEYMVKYDYSKPPLYYSYKNGKIIQTGELDKDSEKPIAMTQFSYFYPAPNTEIIDIARLNPTDGSQKLISRQYTKKKNGTLLEKGVINANGEPQEVYLYEYLPNNKLQITITFLQYKATLIETYALDTIFRPLEEKHLGRMKDPFKENRIDTYTYDDNLNLLRRDQVSYRNGEEIPMQKHPKTFDYISIDSHGNWIERKATEFSRSEYEVREISYYD